MRKSMRALARDAFEARIRALPEDEPTAEEIDGITARRQDFHAGKHRILRPSRNGITRPRRARRRP